MFFKKKNNSKVSDDFLAVLKSEKSVQEKNNALKQLAARADRKEPRAISIYGIALYNMIENKERRQC